MMKLALRAGLVLGVIAIAFAAVNFDPETGTGFVGKGDVQLVLGWNNKQLQDGAGSVQFQASSVVVTEVSWICTNTNNENIQERARTTTATIQGVVSHVARVKNQITGFNLTGYSGDPTESSTTDGPPVNSCPSGPWTLTTPAGDPEVVSSTGGLQVSIDATNWFDLQ
jgi:hypothetical protein